MYDPEVPILSCSPRFHALNPQFHVVPCGLLYYTHSPCFTCTTAIPAHGVLAMSTAPLPILNILCGSTLDACGLEALGNACMAMHQV